MRVLLTMALISCSCLNCIVWFTDKNVQEEKENAALCQDLVELSPDSINRIPDHTIGGLIEDFIKQVLCGFNLIKNIGKIDLLLNKYTHQVIIYLWLWIRRHFNRYALDNRSILFVMLNRIRFD